VTEANKSTSSNQGEASEDTRAAEDQNAAAPNPSQESLERELDEARSKASTYLDLAQRTQADFVNYKRRVEQERGDYARAARADIILKFLGPLDDLARAVDSFPANVAGSDWAQGIGLIDRKFRSALENLGVRPVEVVGKPFDPYQEEAVAHEPSTTQPAETVTRVVRPGYSLDGRMIRPAQVVVSSGPPDDATQ
jgi:molecular chaperone GrpE